MNRIIGLGSKAQIGKDYAAQKLADYTNVKRIAFADALKNDLKYLFNQNDLDFDDIVAEPKLKEKVRPLMVSYGQTMREFKPDVWIGRAIEEAKKPFHGLVIFTDVRFPNEVKAIKELGGFYIEIKTNVPPANETEALYSPQMSALADATVENNFDGNYIPDLAKIIFGLRRLQKFDLS